MRTPGHFRRRHSRALRGHVLAALMCCLCQAAMAQGATSPSRLPMLADLLSIPSRLKVGDAAGGETVSLRGAQLASRVYSLDVESAQRRLESFEYNRDAARGALLPRVDVRNAYGYGVLDSVQPAASLRRSEFSTTVRQVLFDEPARNEWGRQRVLVGSAELQLSGAISQAAFEGGNAFLTALQARVVIELSGDYESMLGELLRYIGERAEAGGASQADSDRVRARVANVRSGLADAQSTLTSALRDLQRVTGIEPGGLNFEEGISLPAVQGRVAALDLAKAANPELRAARAEIDAAEVERKVQRARFLPRVELELTHARNVNLGGNESFTRDSRAMIVLTIPLVNGGSDLAQMRASASRRDELDAKARNVERKLALEIETAYANLEATSARFDSVREELEANRKVADAFQAQMTNASRQLLDVLDAYQRLYQSRLDLAQVLVVEARNQLRLAYLTGSLVDGLAAASPKP
jgi:TolC family type I secretion outer membrane protein